MEQVRLLTSILARIVGSPRKTNIRIRAVAQEASRRLTTQRCLAFNTTPTSLHRCMSTGSGYGNGNGSQPPVVGDGELLKFGKICPHTDSGSRFYAGQFFVHRTLGHRGIIVHSRKIFLNDTVNDKSRDSFVYFTLNHRTGKCYDGYTHQDDVIAYTPTFEHSISHPRFRYFFKKRSSPLLGSAGNEGSSGDISSLLMTMPSLSPADVNPYYKATEMLYQFQEMHDTKITFGHAYRQKSNNVVVTVMPVFKDGVHGSANTSILPNSASSMEMFEDDAGTLDLTGGTPPNSENMVNQQNNQSPQANTSKSKEASISDGQSNHVWNYYMTIENKNKSPVTVERTFHSIANEEKQIRTDYGYGIGGLQPTLSTIRPGFEYTGEVTLETPNAIMCGSYTVFDIKHDTYFDVELPAFYLGFQYMPVEKEKTQV